MTKLSIVQFGVAYAGLSTVGYTVLDANENVVTARTTTGVSEIGTNTGAYRATITLDNGFTGIILWDTGDSDPVYAAESVQPLSASQVEEIVSSSVSALGITRASLVSAICDATGDDGQDAQVKVRRLINQKGRSFVNITNWPFLRNDITFSITSADYKYSGSSYLPTTFKRALVAYALADGERYPLTEVGILDSYKWPNPDNNQGTPSEFCITRVESGYWQIQFNKKPDQTYTVYMEIELQWVDLTGDDSYTVITKDYYDEFVHYVCTARFQQQGDAENFVLYKNDWWDPQNPKCMLKVLLGKLSSPSKKKSVIMDPSYVQPFRNPSQGRDYGSVSE